MLYSALRWNPIADRDARWCRGIGCVHRVRILYIRGDFRRERLRWLVWSSVRVYYRGGERDGVW